MAGSDFFRRIDDVFGQPGQANPRYWETVSFCILLDEVEPPGRCTQGMRGAPGCPARPILKPRA